MSQFVDAQKINTLEDYAESIITSMMSLKTLEMFQLTTIQNGLLENDEIELSEAICWELRRLLLLFKKQMENVKERTPLNEDELLERLQNAIPEEILKIKSKNTNKKKS